MKSCATTFEGRSRARRRSVPTKSISNEALEKALKAHATVNELRPAAADEERLEKELAQLRDLAAQAKAIGNQIPRSTKRSTGCAKVTGRTRRSSAEALDKTTAADGREKLEKRDEEIVRELASLQAALERDERFQVRSRTGCVRSFRRSA